MDPVELRRRNFLQPDEFPYSTVTGVTYDIGDYDAALTEALRIAGYEELRAEQAARRERGDVKQLGIGISAYVEITAGGSGSEFSEVEVHADGSATVKAGTSAHGQGHATAYAQMVSGELGIPIEKIRFVQSDTALVPRGGGTGGSRSLQLGGSAVLGRVACGARTGPKPRGRPARSRTRRHRVVRATARSASPACRRSRSRGRRSRPRRSTTAMPLVVEHDFVQSGASFPFGAHVSVVEVDTETGRVEPIRHIAVDDCGRILNPMLVDGQVHGGLASGIAQALWEQMVYDDDGNPLTSTLAEYAIPSAAEFPPFEVAHTETPSPLNPLGAKGIGESATVGQHARGAERGRRRAQPPRRPPHRHAVQPRARVAHHRGRPRRHPARPVARAPAAFATLPLRQQAPPSKDEEIDL